MSTALSVKQAIVLSELWHELGKGIVYLVTNGQEFLVEGPDERQDRLDEEESPVEVTSSGDSPFFEPVEDEAVLRVFTDHEDAWLYCEMQQENYDTDNTTMRVLTFKLDDLFTLRKAIDNNSQSDFDVNARADVCTLREGEPVVLDTLWTSSAQAN